MREVEELFQRALGLVPPWRVERSAFDAEGRRLDRCLGFEHDRKGALPREIGLQGTRDTALGRQDHTKYGLSACVTHV